MASNFNTYPLRESTTYTECGVYVSFLPSQRVQKRILQVGKVVVILYYALELSFRVTLNCDGCNFIHAVAKETSKISKIYFKKYVFK